MEMKRTGTNMTRPVLCLMLALLFVSAASVNGQAVKKYYIKDGKQCIELSKNISAQELETFMQKYNLNDLALQALIVKKQSDSLRKQGWKMEQESNVYRLTKPMLSFDNFDHPENMVIFSEHAPTHVSFAPNAQNVRFGLNKFTRKRPFTENGETVTFFLRDRLKAKSVMLAGSFTNWQAEAFPMRRTDSGWVAQVKLSEGKHWYKFIVDDNWIIDDDNLLRENDSKGNINSVFYRSNVQFRLPGYLNAKKVYLAGSFNNWRRNELSMVKTATGWWLPVYLPEGTHTYKFIVDGTWMHDPGNKNLLPDGWGAFNSYISYGKEHMFRLEGFEKARKVAVAGSFNGWKDNELFLIKTSNGWALPYVLGPGNYEYKFIVDGKWMPDPSNRGGARNDDGNSFLVIAPNYTFRLKGFENERHVSLGGDFNGWNRQSLTMQREGSDWVFRLHLAPGKHRYKFFVDNKWILDPGNKLWEQNEYGTGNSIIWIGE